MKAKDIFGEKELKGVSLAKDLTTILWWGTGQKWKNRGIARLY